jgi:metal-responsive CopG/Arc/MetJ family transcriptional regulator
VVALICGITIVILFFMKTAISIPDPIFQAAENMAKRLGMSRSELFTVAMSKYMKEHKYQNVTESLNKIYSQDIEDIDKELVSMQLKLLPKEDW